MNKKIFAAAAALLFGSFVANAQEIKQDTWFISGQGGISIATADVDFGKKIAGGYYVSGEASYIQKIGQYYYLFMSYGGLNAVAGGDWPYGAVGYQMRVFRSEKPDGPYMDCNTKNVQNEYPDAKILFRKRAF